MCLVRQKSLTDWLTSYFLIFWNFSFCVNWLAILNRDISLFSHPNQSDIALLCCIFIFDYCNRVVSNKTSNKELYLLHGRSSSLLSPQSSRPSQVSARDMHWPLSQRNSMTSRHSEHKNRPRHRLHCSMHVLLGHKQGRCDVCSSLMLHLRH